MIFQNYIHQALIIRILNQLVDHQPVVEYGFQQMRNVFIFKPFGVFRYLAAIPVDDDLRFVQAVIPGNRRFRTNTPIVTPGVCECSPLRMTTLSRGCDAMIFSQVRRSSVSACGLSSSGFSDCPISSRQASSLAASTPVKISSGPQIAADFEIAVMIAVDEQTADRALGAFIEKQIQLKNGQRWRQEIQHLRIVGGE